MKILTQANKTFFRIEGFIHMQMNWHMQIAYPIFVFDENFLFLMSTNQQQ